MTVGLLFGMEETISRPLGSQSRNGFDGCNRKDTARAAITADFDHGRTESAGVEPPIRLFLYEAIIPYTPTAVDNTSRKKRA